MADRHRSHSPFSRAPCCLRFLPAGNLAGTDIWPKRDGTGTAWSKARDTFVELAHLQPRVTVNNRVYLEQTTTVAELAVLARRVEVEHEMLHTWAGSTKRIKLHGTYLVKAGFDLRKRFTVNVHPTKS
jgi:hypothetical protein